MPKVQVGKGYSKMPKSTVGLKGAQVPSTRTGVSNVQTQVYNRLPAGLQYATG